MKTSPLTIRKPQCSLATLDLARYCEGWLLACDIAEHSEQTLKLRKIICDKLLWFLHSKNLAECGTLELRQFFSYLKHGHEQPGGRWGNPQQTRPVKSGTIATYDRRLRTLFTWLVKEEAIEVFPMDTVDDPVDRAVLQDPGAVATSPSGLLMAFVADRRGTFSHGFSKKLDERPSLPSARRAREVPWGRRGRIGSLTRANEFFDCCVFFDFKAQ